MADQFVAEIRIFPFNFPPTGWAFCNGQLLPITQNTALFSLVGTFYGGDGKSTFGLPNLQGMAAMHQGNGPGLSQRTVGETSGSTSVTLTQQEMPSHSHSPQATTASSDDNTPTGNVFSRPSTSLYATGSPTLTAMSASALLPVGGSGPHNNMAPYLALSYCIALQGIFPARG